MNRDDEEVLKHYLWLTLWGLNETEQMLNLVQQIMEMDYKQSLRDSIE